LDNYIFFNFYFILLGIGDWGVGGGGGGGWGGGRTPPPTTPPPHHPQTQKL